MSGGTNTIVTCSGTDKADLPRRCKCVAAHLGLCLGRPLAFGTMMRRYVADFPVAHGKFSLIPVKT